MSETNPTDTRLLDLANELANIHSGLDALYLIGRALHQDEKADGNAVHFLSETMLAVLEAAQSSLDSIIAEARAMKEAGQ